MSKLKNRLKTTRLYDNFYPKLGWIGETSTDLTQNALWSTGNFTELLNKLNTGIKIGGMSLSASYTARSAGINLYNGVEDLCNE